VPNSLTSIKQGYANWDEGELPYHNGITIEHISGPEDSQYRISSDVMVKEPWQR
jgi:hypothetical protein